MNPAEVARERFRELVQRLGGPGPAAKAIGCSRAYVEMLKSGARTRPGLGVAWAIERASDGEIPMRAWIADEPTQPAASGE